MRLRRLQITALSAVLLSWSVLPSAAQSPVRYGARSPVDYGGLVAIAAAFGGALPTADRLDNGLFAGVAILVSMASHVGLSAEAGADRVAVNRPGFRGHLMPRFADLNLLVHWKSGPFRPFVIGGVGVYRYTIDVSSDAFSDPALRSELMALGLSPSKTTSIQTRHDEAGINLGGGFEYFFAPRSALTMDLRGHATRDFVEVAPFGGVFVNAAIGFRQYF